ncbi:cell wall-active antibiotics response protein LiaF [Gracilibacillus dipsosauri]|uniref:cell wall-active antibiotics response protein LiaF n=1 Tax=Gracilibacillus dipsosauri TaxID=178340 RepID=UPI0024095B6C
MVNKTRTDWIHILFIIGCVLFAIEFIFINPGHLFTLLLSGFAIYFGKRSYHKMSGKTIFWGGVFFLFITIIDTFAVRFIILAIIFYIAWSWYKTKKEPKQYHLDSSLFENVVTEGKVFWNKWFGKYDKSSQPYAWQDMNIQSFVSDISIDLNNTMLPKEESTVIIRQLVGNVRIIVPYDVEVSIDHSVLYGEIQVFEHKESNAFNRNIQMQTDHYHTSSQKVKIYTQVLIGKLEVIRG